MDPAASAPGPTPDPAPRPGATARVLTWSRSTAHHAVQWSVAARRTHRSVDVGFRLADRDKRVAAGVLAGGVAYRMFFWMLSVSVLSTGALGVVDGAWLDETLRELGLRPTAVDAIAQFLQGSDDAQWWLILVGGWLVLWTGYLGAKALVLVHAAVWGVPAPQAQKQWVMSLVFSGTAAAFIVSMSVADSIQARGGGVGFVAFLVSTSIPCALWLAVSSRLPHAAGGWKHLVPGALLVGTGAQAVQQLATWFLAPKLASATQLYGLLGIVATALFGLYILARLIIAGATLNASVGEQRSAAARHPDGPTHP